MLKVPIVVGFVGAALGLACVDDGRCGGASTASVCPPPAVGFAVVEGTVVNATGSAVVGKQVYVSCGPVAGAYDQRTNARGEFRVAPVYGSLEGPPPLDADGMFRLACSVAVIGLAARDTVTVPFAPTRNAVTPVFVALRESQ